MCICRRQMLEDQRHLMPSAKLVARWAGIVCFHMREGENAGQGEVTT